MSQFILKKQHMRNYQPCRHCGYEFLIGDPVVSIPSPYRRKWVCVKCAIKLGMIKKFKPSNRRIGRPFKTDMRKYNRRNRCPKCNKFRNLTDEHCPVCYTKLVMMPLKPVVMAPLARD